MHNHATRLKALPVDGLHIDLMPWARPARNFSRQLPCRESALPRCRRWAQYMAFRPCPIALDAVYACKRSSARDCGLRRVVLFSIARLISSWRHVDEEIKSWLAFSIQKLHEVSALGRGLNHGEDAISDILTFLARQVARAQSARIHNPMVQERLQGLTQKESERASPFPARQARQRQRFKLPLLPTTTIGSFPQTPEIRQARAAFKKSELGNLQYLEAMRDEIALAIRKQEEIGLDVLVHGEVERNDMVEYFGEQLWRISHLPRTDGCRATVRAA